MPPDKPALLKESVSFNKSNEGAVFKGEFELFDDSVVLKISHRFSLSSLVRSLPPTFPAVEMIDTIPFSRVTGISGGRVKGFLSRNVKIELHTDEGVSWDIRGPGRILDALQNAYRAWKHSARQ
jgi:hypothetical protein